MVKGVWPGRFGCCDWMVTPVAVRQAAAPLLRTRTAKNAEGVGIHLDVGMPGVVIGSIADEGVVVLDLRIPGDGNLEAVPDAARRHCECMYASGEVHSGGGGAGFGDDREGCIRGGRRTELDDGAQHRALLHVVVTVEQEATASIKEHNPVEINGDGALGVGLGRLRRQGNPQEDQCDRHSKRNPGNLLARAAHRTPQSLRRLSKPFLLSSFLFFFFGGGGGGGGGGAARVDLPVVQRQA